MGSILLMSLVAVVFMMAMVGLLSSQQDRKAQGQTPTARPLWEDGHARLRAALEHAAEQAFGPEVRVVDGVPYSAFLTAPSRRVQRRLARTHTAFVVARPEGQVLCACAHRPAVPQVVRATRDEVLARDACAAAGVPVCTIPPSWTSGDLYHGLSTAAKGQR